jgi:hypothetical protein
MDDLTRAIQEADSFFGGNEPGASSAAPIMKYIASAETNYGNYNPETALSYGPFQIDPIRYYDIVQNPNRLNEKHQGRINRVNEHLRKKFNDPNFDIQKLAIYNPQTNDYEKDSRNLQYLRDPDVGAMLARLAMKQSPDQLPSKDKLGEYYESFWGPKWTQSEDENLKNQKRSEAKSRYDLHHGEKDVVDDVVKEQGSEAF